jgi:hypothetical protein
MAGGKFGFWFKCKGCGEPIGFFPDGLASAGLEPGSVAHTKPKRFTGIPNSVPCELYNRLDAQALADLHVGAEPLPEPENFEAILG